MPDKPIVYERTIFSAWKLSRLVYGNFTYSKSNTPAADSVPFIPVNQACQQKLVQPRLKAHRLIADIARL